MRERLSGPLMALALCAGACVKQYAPPKANEPHALVKLRRVFHSAPGPLRGTSALVNGEQVFARDEPAQLDAPQTDAVRIHPGPGEWRFSVTYHHSEMRHVQESYQEQVPYTTQEAYTTYSGGKSSTQYRTVTKYRSETRYRWVDKQVDVIDDHCDVGLSQQFEDGQVYLLQFTYTGAGQCSVTCMEQQASADGGTENRPCSGASVTSD